MSYRHSPAKFVMFCFVLLLNLFSLSSVIAPVPNGAADQIEIKNYKGNLTRKNMDGGFIIESIEGNADLEAYGGSISIVKIIGDLKAFTSAGDIKLGNCSGKIEAMTQGGNIFVDHASGPVIAQTGIGEIIIHAAESVNIDNLLGGDVKLFHIKNLTKVKTSGNILLNITENKNIPELCDLYSSDGDIIIEIPEDFGADVEIKIPLSENPDRETSIKSDFDFSDYKQRCEENRIIYFTTQINGGGPKISVFVEKGDVYFVAIEKSDIKGGE